MYWHRQTLTTLLPKAEIERLAHESGAVRRRRKVDASAMLWTVLLGFGTGRERTLAGLRRTYERVTGKSLVPSSFYDRFSTELGPDVSGGAARADDEARCERSPLRRRARRIP